MAKDQTKIQMMALYLTSQYHESAEGDFFINCTKFQEECSAPLPMCDGVETVLFSDVWAYLQSHPSASIAECLNTYNDGCSGIAVDFPTCDPGSFTGLAACLTKPGNAKK